MCIVHLLSPMCGAAVYNVLLKHTQETLNVMFCLSMSAKLCMLTMLNLTLTLQSLHSSHMCAHDGIKVVLFLHIFSFNISTICHLIATANEDTTETGFMQTLDLCH